MNKKVALGALLSSCFAQGASAQSSVTLYGVIDSSVQYFHNVAGQSTRIGLASGGISGSRWGLKGAEDLGGGLKAVFQLENGFDAENGKLKQGGREFGRQAFVGLSIDTIGKFTVGRQYDPLNDEVQSVQGNGYLGGFFSAPGDVDNADNSIRISNSVKWASPSWGPFHVTALYGFGGVAGSVGSGQVFSAAASYRNGPAAISAGYMRVDNGNPVTSARGTSAADSLFGSSVNAAYSSAKSIEIVRAGATYQLAQLTLGTYVSFSDYEPDASSAYRTSEIYRNGSLFALWKFNSALLGEVGYNLLNASGASSATYHQGTVGLDYLVSKRTDVYGVAAYTHARGSNGAGPAQAVVGSVNVDAGKSSQLLLTLGLRHRF
jgi:predicted porin